MSKNNNNYPLIVVLGTTATGKSDLALKLAYKFNGAIICADSRTIYRGMNIGTAKPTVEDRRKIQHYCVDIVNPDQNFSVMDFKLHAMEAMHEIYAAGKIPILVGGTGLYIDAIIFNYQFPLTSDHSLRHRLSLLTVEELQEKLLSMGIPLPNNSRNPRHLIRKLETMGETGTKEELRSNTLLLGISIDSVALQRRIEQRVDAMINAGLVNEVRELAGMYGWDAASLQTPGYKAFRNYIEGNITLDEAREAFIRNDLQYAKRQRTWFRRNNSIQWLTTEELPLKSVDLVTTFLNK